MARHPRAGMPLRRGARRATATMRSCRSRIRGLRSRRCRSPSPAAGAIRKGRRSSANVQIHQDHIIENYTESIHGEGLLKKGLIVSATCASCHTAHLQLPHTDPNSSIARKNIAATCTKCHAQIETVHRKVIKGELWEREAHVLPACVDCHQPHKARKVFYDQGMSDKDCLRCHSRKELVSSKNGRSLYVAQEHLGESRHVRVACSQCHAGVNVAKVRPCETITQPVDCASCHAEVAQQYVKSTHGQLDRASGSQRSDAARSATARTGSSASFSRSRRRSPRTFRVCAHGATAKERRRRSGTPVTRRTSSSITTRASMARA